MLLIIEVLLLIFAIYRGWLFESLSILFLFILVQLFISELGILNYRLDRAIEIIFILSLLFLSFYKKKLNLKRCPNCQKPLFDSRYSCVTCGFPLTEDIFEAIKAESTNIVRLILRDKKDFKQIKRLIKDEYIELGFEEKVSSIDNYFIMKSEDSYILATLKGFDLTIETYKIDLPNFIDTNTKLFVQ